jgi:4-aminobutyrate aminotransferase-like enzyme
MSVPENSLLGDAPPLVTVRPPGAASRTWLTRASRTAVPMGPSRTSLPKRRIAADVPADTVVFATARGSNVVDVDGNRYVDLVAGFGSMLLGHGHPSILRVLELQSARLLQALGDVYPSDAKIALMERLAALYPKPNGRVLLGQSGADSVTAALKTAMLVTGKPGVVAFRGAYHGLSYAPLSVCGLRESYRAPFAEQLSAHAAFIDFPSDEASAARVLEDARAAFSKSDAGAVIVEPVLGRGGCVVPPPGFLASLAEIARERGALFIADEIWTGLGRAGSMLRTGSEGVVADLICLGKGLGGGLPMSACIGSDEVMSAWRRDPEVVHTATFAGAPLAAATAIATLDVLSREKLVQRSRDVGAIFLDALRTALSGIAGVEAVRGAGLMIGVDLGPKPGAASHVMKRLLERGYLVSTGGGGREVVVLTPPLTISEARLMEFVPVLADVLGGFSA